MSRKPIDAEDIAVLLRLQAALPNVGLNGWFEGVRVLARVIEHLTAAQQQGGGEADILRTAAEYHYAQAACPRDQFGNTSNHRNPRLEAWHRQVADAITAITPPPSAPVGVKTLSEFMAEQEAIHPGIHDKVQAATDELRASLAQKPEARGGEEVVAFDIERARTLIEYVVGYARSAELKPLSSDACVALRDLHELLHTAPPSAPVGVEGLIEAAKAAESMLRTVHECASHECEDCREYAGIVAKKLRAALAQQPAAVDEAYPTPRNRAEAAALARLALAHLGVIDAHIDAAIARCETNSAAQRQEPKS